MKLLIKNGRVIDPSQQLDESLDVLISDGKIAKCGKSIPQNDAQVIDASKKIVVPGLIDIHVHLREPGQEHKETIATGTLAAARGGFATMACMPNTIPVIDDEATIRFVANKTAAGGKTNVLVIASLTKKAKGEEIADFGELREAGAVALSDDAFPVMNSEVMRRAMEYAGMFDLPVITHCEDTHMTAEGSMNEGFTATVLGLRGMPAQAEIIMAARNIYLSELTGCRLHIAHVSTAGTVSLVRQAKKRGIRVTAETAPHYFTMTEESVRGYNVNAKMNPPLRSASDVEEIKKGIADGTIDCIASDHAPHTNLEKQVEFVFASFGVIGLETTLGIVLTKLVNEKVITLNEAIAMLTVNPARVLGIDSGTLKTGADANVTVIDPDKKWKVDVNQFASKGRNCPFDGWELTGAAHATIVRGTVVHCL